MIDSNYGNIDFIQEPSSLSKRLKKTWPMILVTALGVLFCFSCGGKDLIGLFCIFVLLPMIFVLVFMQDNHVESWIHWLKPWYIAHIPKQDQILEVDHQNLVELDPEMETDYSAMETEKNMFGYVLNIIMASICFLGLVYILFQIYNEEDGVQIMNIYFEQFSASFLALSLLFMGTFHSYILHDQDYEKKKKQNSGLLSRIIYNWPLIVGIILYFFFLALCFRTFIYRYFFATIAFLSIPLMFTAVFLSNNSVDSWSRIFKPWNIKAKNDDTESENETIIYEFKYFGFFYTLFMSGTCVLLVLNLVYEFTKIYADTKMFIEGFNLYIGFLLLVVVNLVVLFYPKFDFSSSDGSWTGLFQNNWPLFLACSLLWITFILNFKSTSAVEYAIIIFSIISCVVIPTRNDSDSWIVIFKPWIIKKKTEEVSV